LALHPLDLVKTRFQVNDGSLPPGMRYRSVLDAFRTILRVEGAEGLFKGALTGEASRVLLGAALQGGH
jgi:hypothetical protein